MDLKAQLTQLIADSPTLQSLSAEEKNFRADAMLNSNEQAMAEFIKILQNEKAQFQKADENYAKSTAEIEGLVAEAKQLEKEAEGLIRKETEAEEQVSEKEHAENLLKQLDEIGGKDKN